MPSKSIMLEKRVPDLECFVCTRFSGLAILVKGYMIMKLELSLLSLHTNLMTT